MRIVALVVALVVLLPGFAAQAQGTGDVPEGFDHYEAANFPVALVYDPELWELVKNVPAERNRGRDLLRLRSTDDALPAELSVESFDEVSRASECFDLKLDELAPSGEAVEPITERNGDPIEDSRRGIKYAAYSLESGERDVDAIYIECRALPGGRGVVASTLVTGLSVFDDALDAALDVLDTITIIERVAPTATAAPTETAIPTPDAPADALFVSPSLGYYIAPIDGWALVLGSSEDGVDGVALIDPNGLDIRVRASQAIDGATPESCVQASADRYAAGNGVELTVAPDGTIDRPSIGGGDGTAYGTYAYVFQGVSRVLFTWCGASPDGSVLVSVRGDIEAGSVGLMVASVDAVAAAVRF
jgi:hypothetical protein